MKILYICSADLSGQFGSLGSVRHIMEVAENLLKLGHNLILIAPRFRKKYPDKTSVRLTYVPLIPVRFFRTIIYELLSPLYMLFYIIIFHPQIIYWRQSYLTIAPVLLARLLGKKIVVEVNGVTLEEVESEPLNWLRKKAILTFEDFNYRFASHLIVVAPRIKDIISRAYGLASRKVTVLLNGVNIDKIRPLSKLETRKKLGLTADSKIVGFIGHLFPWSGIEVLINAAPLIKNQIPNTKFLIIGHGKWGKKLPDHARLKGMENDFIFTGKIHWNLIHLYINSFDIGVAPYTQSIDTKSGSSLKILEYLACGKPVVASKTDSIPEIMTLKEKNLGILVPPEKPDALAKAIVKLLKDKSFLEHVSIRCRSYVEKERSWIEVAKKTQKLLLDLISES